MQTCLKLDFKKDSPANIWDNVVEAIVVVVDIVLVVILIGSISITLASQMWANPSTFDIKPN